MTLWKDAAGALHDDMDGVALDLPAWPQGMTALTDAQASAAQAPSVADLRAAFLASAKLALAATSTTLERITEAVALSQTTWQTTDVVAWLTYRRQLRAIVDGSDQASTALPTKPAYPANT